ncbi:MAG: phosphoribosylglycinamide formyltransferase, partial [Holophagae bacterium]|nr:phosphoribosylglycinamide formyltransferase [Holophagae bacterium]
KGYGYPVFASDERDQRELSRRINEFILAYHPDVIVLAGFLKLYSIPDGFEGRVLNIHPALVPAFCGKGFYGMKVHRAVVESGVKVTGCTVHFVSPVYDEGPIFLQECVPVSADDKPEDVAARVFELECSLYPKALNLLAEGRVKLNENKVWIEER